MEPLAVVILVTNILKLGTIVLGGAKKLLNATAEAEAQLVVSAVETALGVVESVDVVMKKKAAARQDVPESVDSALRSMEVALGYACSLVAPEGKKNLLRNLLSPSPKKNLSCAANRIQLALYGLHAQMLLLCMEDNAFSSAAQNQESSLALDTAQPIGGRRPYSDQLLMESFLMPSTPQPVDGRSHGEQHFTAAPCRFTQYQEPILIYPPVPSWSEATLSSNSHLYEHEWNMSPQHSPSSAAAPPLFDGSHGDYRPPP